MDAVQVLVPRRVRAHPGAQVSNARYIVGPALDVLRSLPDGSVDLCLTSPPFLALRSYLPPDHPDKAKEVGSEPTPGEFIDALLDHVEEVRRVLAPHGSLAWELGDTYAGSGWGGGDYLPGGLRFGQVGFDGSAARDHNASHWRQKNAEPAGWPLDKSLCLVPELFRFALAYGFNPLTGRTTPRWRIRNVIRWTRPNPPVGDLADKFRPATSEMVVACVGRRRYFDLDAVRTSTPDLPRVTLAGQASASKGITGGDSGNPDKERLTHHPAGAPPLDHWEPLAEEQAMWEEWRDAFGEQMWRISTAPYKGAHYATWPPALCVRPVKAMCPERVCRTCGVASERIVDVSRIADRNDVGRRKNANGERPAAGRMDRAPEFGWEMSHTTLGWTDCGHNNYRPGVVLDPFAGSGTTLAVATGHGRDAIGIDLDARNADLARERVGMFLTTEHHSAETVA